MKAATLVHARLWFFSGLALLPLSLLLGAANAGTPAASCCAVVPALAVLAVGLWLWQDWSDGFTCPYCGEWEAVVFGPWRVVEQKKCAGLVVRTAHSTRRGLIIGNRNAPTRPTWESETTSWEERVPVVRTTSARDCTCSYCKREWVVEQVTEEEDFEPDEPLPPVPPVPPAP